MRTSSNIYHSSVSFVYNGQNSVWNVYFLLKWNSHYVLYIHRRSNVRMYICSLLHGVKCSNDAIQSYQIVPKFIADAMPRRSSIPLVCLLSSPKRKLFLALYQISNKLLKCVCVCVLIYIVLKKNQTRNMFCVAPSVLGPLPFIETFSRNINW